MNVAERSERPANAVSVNPTPRIVARVASIEAQGRLIDAGIAPVLARLDALAKQVADAPAAAAPVSKRAVIFANLPRVDSEQLEARTREIDALFRGLENEQLEYVAMLWPKDLPVELHRGPLVAPDKILAAARLMESLGRPFLFFACHGAAPNLSIDILKQTLDAAPTACRGFYVAENMEQYGSARWKDFLVWTGEVLELCRQRGKQVIFKEMYEAWSSVAALPDVRSSILQPKYRDTVVAMYATNNPHAPELQLAGMIGLHHAGRISGWGISTQYWNWSWSEHTVQQHWPNLPRVILRWSLTRPASARNGSMRGGQSTCCALRRDRFPCAAASRDRLRPDPQGVAARCATRRSSRVLAPRVGPHALAEPGAATRRWTIAGFGDGPRRGPADRAARRWRNDADGP